MKKVRVVLLARISSDKEEGTDTSIPTQVAAGTAYVATKANWELVKVITEEGVSGFDETQNRPGLEQALRMIETGQADVLLVWKLDRFVRSLMRFVTYWGRIQAAKGEFASVVESFDTTTTMGKLMLIIVAAFAEMESEMKRDRALPFHQYRRDQGLPAGGPRPFGYTRGFMVKDEKQVPTLLTVDDEAAVVREMAADIISGMSLAALVRKLAEAGVAYSADPEEEGAPLTLKGVKGVLLNPTVAGLRRNADKETFCQGNWQPILERAVWEQVGTILGDPKRRTSFNAGKPAHLLTGFAQCSECKVTLVRKNHPAGLRLLCRNCNSSLPMQVADDAVTLWLMDAIDPQTWKNLKEQGRGYDPVVVAKLQAEKAEVAQMKADGDIDLAQFKILNADLNARIAAAQDETPLDLPDIKDLQTGWEPLDLMGKRTIIMTLLESVQLAPHSTDCKGRDRVMIERAV
jgi:site-specific DNA recombinase